MKNTNVKAFLDEQHVHFTSIPHSPAYTAQETAESIHVPGRRMAKTVIVEMDGKLVMAVLSANSKINLQDLRALTGTDRVRLASEQTFQNRFPDCETGAMPPLGSLYGMDVFVAPELAQNNEIAFNAGSHEEAIKISYEDFERMTHPKVVAFA